VAAPEFVQRFKYGRRAGTVSGRCAVDGVDGQCEPPFPDITGEQMSEFVHAQVVATIRVGVRLRRLRPKLVLAAPAEARPETFARPDPLHQLVARAGNRDIRGVETA